MVSTTILEDKYTVGEKVVCILPAPSAKYPEVYVHPCTKSTRLHEIPRCASHQGWSSRFLVTIGHGDSGMLFVAFPGIHLRWVVHGGAQDVNGNVCGSFSNLFILDHFGKLRI